VRTPRTPLDPPIILLFQFNWDFIYSAIIHLSDVSDDPDEIFACRVQRRSQRPLRYL
jgi:hypothetical protein